MNFSNDLNYVEFKNEGVGDECIKMEDSIMIQNSNCLDAVDNQIKLGENNQCLTKEKEKRDLLKNGLGEIQNIPQKKILAASNVMKRPDQLLGFVPAMGGVYKSSNGVYGSGKLAHV